MSQSSITLKLSKEDVILHIMNYDDLINELTNLNQILDPTCYQYCHNIQRIKRIQEAKQRLLMDNHQLSNNLDENNKSFEK